jgi:hypothetical protein
VKVLWTPDEAYPYPQSIQKQVLIKSKQTQRGGKTMKTLRGMTFLVVGAVVIVAAMGVAVSPAADVLTAPNGLVLPEGYKSWRIIASSHRTDNNTLRIILGNDKAIEAARAGRINPWPDGAVLAKLVWKDTTHPEWPAATLPGNFVHAEFMFKDAKKFTSTGGWGFARWLGLEQKPYGKDADFVQECYGCHLPVKDNDYLFTRPAVLP